MRCQIKARARAAVFDFNQPEWENISASAKDLIRRLICKDPNVRPCGIAVAWRCQPAPPWRRAATLTRDACVGRDCAQQRLDADGILTHDWFSTRLSSTPISSDINLKISGFQIKYRRKLKASIYGSMFVASLRSMSAKSLAIRSVSPSVFPALL